MIPDSIASLTAGGLRGGGTVGRWGQLVWARPNMLPGPTAGHLASVIRSPTHTSG